MTLDAMISQEGWVHLKGLCTLSWLKSIRAEDPLPLWKSFLSSKGQQKKDTCNQARLLKS